jgi:hypothetical protein
MLILKKNDRVKATDTLCSDLLSLAAKLEWTLPLYPKGFFFACNK